ncbi:MAG: hypothetical protein RLZZ15_331 [Verrucomicrobiota bacterium]|jgi:acyl carrier protein
METELLKIVNEVRVNKGLGAITSFSRALRLREDLAFVSLDLAELTVRVEEKFGVDVFADGLVETLGELQDRISKPTKK